MIKIITFGAINVIPSTFSAHNIINFLPFHNFALEVELSQRQLVRASATFKSICRGSWRLRDSENVATVGTEE